MLRVGRELPAVRPGANRPPEGPADDDRDRHGATNPRPLHRPVDELGGRAVDASRPSGCAPRQSTPSSTQASNDCPPAGRLSRFRCWQLWPASRQARAARSLWRGRREASPPPRRQPRRPWPVTRPSPRASPHAALPPAPPQAVSARFRPVGAPSRHVPPRTSTSRRGQESRSTRAPCTSRPSGRSGSRTMWPSSLGGSGPSPLESSHGRPDGRTEGKAALGILPPCSRESARRPD